MQSPKSPASVLDSVSEDYSILSPTTTDKSLGLEVEPQARAPLNAPVESISTPHTMYYMKDGMVDIRVQDVLFRLPQFFFMRDSPFFRTLLEDHQSAGHSETADSPKALNISDEDVTVEAFDCLMKVMFPPKFDAHALTTANEWRFVLHLADKWGFESIRALAIRELLPLASPIDRIVYARKYCISEWLEDAFQELIERKEPLSLEEGRRMAIDDVIKLSAARETRIGSTVQPCGHTHLNIKLTKLDPKSDKLALPGGAQPQGSKVSFFQPTANLTSAHLSWQPVGAVRPDQSSTQVSQLTKHELTELIGHLRWGSLSTKQQKAMATSRIAKFVASDNLSDDSLRMVVAEIVESGAAMAKYFTIGDAKKDSVWDMVILCKTVVDTVRTDMGNDAQNSPLLGRQLAQKYILDECRRSTDEWGPICAPTLNTKIDLLTVKRATAFTAYLVHHDVIPDDIIQDCWKSLTKVVQSSDSNALADVIAFVEQVGPVIDLPSVHTLAEECHAAIEQAQKSVS